MFIIWRAVHDAYYLASSTLCLLFGELHLMFIIWRAALDAYYLASCT